jgi:hypothetical protein
MRLPDFLIIGAMKAGTTTLFRDLMQNPRVFFPLDKEPECLCHDRVLTPEGLREYAAMFAKAAPHQRCAEASTAYTKRPVFEGAAERAMRVLGPELRVLYIVRDPIKRIVSQHRHEIAVGRLETRRDVNEAVREIDRYLAYSRYAHQLMPWVETFGVHQVRVILLERYVKARAETVRAASEFLGVEPVLEGIDQGRVFNKGDEQRVMRGPWRWLLRAGVYRRVVRPLLSIETREKLRGALLPRAASAPTSLTAESADWVRQQLKEDTSRFLDVVNGLGLLLVPGLPLTPDWK